MMAIHKQAVESPTYSRWWVRCHSGTMEYGCVIVCALVFSFFMFVIELPAVEGDVPVLVDGEEHGGGREGGEAGKLTLAHLSNRKNILATL